jgi:hypothetical protein
MTFNELLTRARRDLREVAPSSDAARLLPSERALELFNEAEAEGARRSRCLVDRTTPGIALLTLTENVGLVALDRRVLKVRKAMLGSRPLTRITAADMDARYPGWEEQAAGATWAYVPDYETGKIALYPAPDADSAAQALRLAVVRLPLFAMDEDGEPEIPAGSHPALGAYVLAQVFDTDDTELYDPRKAARFEARFEAEFGPKRSALQEAFEASQPFPEYD